MVSWWSCFGTDSKADFTRRCSGSRDCWQTDSYCSASSQSCWCRPSWAWRCPWPVGETKTVMRMASEETRRLEGEESFATNHLGFKEQLSTLHCDLVGVGQRRSKGEDLLVREHLQRPRLAPLVHWNGLSTHTQPQLRGERAVPTLPDNNRKRLFLILKPCFYYFALKLQISPEIYSDLYDLPVICKIYFVQENYFSRFKVFNIISNSEAKFLLWRI